MARRDQRDRGIFALHSAVDPYVEDPEIDGDIDARLGPRGNSDAGEADQTARRALVD